ncbi:hypothetical protein MVLG_03627 [Microbotryum lychnidis-dioicae p1A1 Lamole]|uniref:RRM domain-containing protein n=1 Tax=Microbotryum lychnidis-dioicae (strain p1A1 Lamole / MvSl-1064) TaxID=683840 RepID=U5H8S7_USTV1|nr:hypothetical protein MVLG_03627 [Microbotryum lychnidis-dioicae p1A1 Lamole]|eukprot:KDE06076.1 hypothetical protein MVLG_03627 [Microbotryum lychnidis-dioicae p1A1 Lamole]
MAPIMSRLGGRASSALDDSQRPRLGPDRSHSASWHRAEPYSQARPDPSTLPSWKQDGVRADLFDEGSSRYNIRLNQGLFPHADPPAPEVLRRVEHVPEHVAPAAIAGPVAVNTSSTAADLADRFLSGSTGAARPSSAPAAPRHDPAYEQRARKVQQHKEHEERRLRKLAEDEAKKTLQQQQENARLQRKIADFEGKGFVIQVEGLVYGTSADDVQTAFGAYGETTFCFIVNEATAREDDPLIARLTFKRFEDAADACAKLHGAIADGRELTVKQVERTPPPATSTDILGTAPSSLISVSTSYSAPLSHNQPLRSKPDPPTRFADTRYAKHGRSMHDDNGMDVDMSEPTPARSSTVPSARNQSGPSRGLRGGGSGGGRHGPMYAGQNSRSDQHTHMGPKGYGQAQIQTQTPVSLLDRLGGGVGNIRGGHTAGKQGDSGRGGGNAPRQPQKNSGRFQSLVARMS